MQANTSFTLSLVRTAHTLHTANTNNNKQFDQPTVRTLALLQLLACLPGCLLFCNAITIHATTTSQGSSYSFSASLFLFRFSLLASSKSDLYLLCTSSIWCCCCILFLSPALNTIALSLFFTLHHAPSLRDGADFELLTRPQCRSRRCVAVASVAVVVVAGLIINIVVVVVDVVGVVVAAVNTFTHAGG